MSGFSLGWFRIIMGIFAISDPLTFGEKSGKGREWQQEKSGVVAGGVDPGGMARRNSGMAGVSAAGYNGSCISICAGSNASGPSIRFISSPPARICGSRFSLRHKLQGF